MQAEDQGVHLNAQERPTLAVSPFPTPCWWRRIVRTTWDWSAAAGMADAALVSMLVQSSAALPRFAKMQHGLVVR